MFQMRADEIFLTNQAILIFPFPKLYNYELLFYTNALVRIKLIKCPVRGDRYTLILQSMCES